jgi:ABC-type nitrate/sulfonate/bicarbonate transport system permease component
MRNLIVFLGVLLIWQAVAFFSPSSIPGPIHIVMHSFPSLAAFSGEDENYGKALLLIAHHSGVTLIRILVGLLIGTVLGTATGMAIHFFKPARAGNAILLGLIRSVPLFALIPLFLYWFGGTELSVYAYISFGVFVVMATSAYEALCNVSPNLIRQAELLGANNLQVFGTVHLFAIQPEMAAAFRTVVGLSWAFSLGAEYLSSTSGLGYLVFQSYLYADMGKLIVLASIYGCYGIVSYALCERLFHTALKWHGAY